MESPSRRRIENPKPEAGLAEWTSKIKALQRDVDADEEIEQRKLEEEIRSSRLARSRRSGGGQFAGKIPLQSIHDQDQDGEDQASSPADALRKLTGEPTSPTPATAPSHFGERTLSSGAASRAEPVSLAAFIGGRATGPRLNRPAAQPDAHDPTLFEQRTRADIVAPHPVFGSGGIALPGLAGKGREVVEAQPRATEEPRVAKTETVVGATPARSWARERTVSTPSRYLPPKPVERERERSTTPVMPTGAPGVRGRVESLYANANRSVERVAPPPVMRSSKSIDKMAQRPAAPAKPEALRKSQPTSVETPRRISTSPPAAATPPPRSKTPTSATPSHPTSISVSPSISTPSLARPVQAQQRPTSTGPHIPLSKNPAPAFLKPAQTKDLTPSLSRLQGRGFVQNFVKLSSEIEAASSGSPERTGSPKRNSVMDRWNPPSPSPSASPVSAPQMRKAKTLDAPRSSPVELSSAPTPAPETEPEPVKPTPQPKPRSHTGSAKSTPSKTKNTPAPGDVLPLGSSNTLISYIKPTKTGDTPATDASEALHPRSKTPSRHADENVSGIDELGMRPRSRTSTPSPAKAKSDLSSVASGRPLNHPTKERAKVRRRGPAGKPAPENADRSASILDRHSIVISPPDNEVAVFSTSPSQETSPPISQLMINPLSSSLSQREEPSATSPSVARGENIRRLQDTWGNQAPIGVKPLRKPAFASPSPTRSTFSQNPTKSSKVALPGLAVESTAVSPPSPPLTPPLTVRPERKTSSPSPVRHSRIPSTGSRATVMDVAQAFGDAASPISPAAPKSPAAHSFSRSPVVSSEEDQERDRDPGGWGDAEYERTITPASMMAERRRSNYEKYASFMLPVLPEEKTPASSPAGTLKDVDFAAIRASAEAKEREEKETRVEKPVPPKKPEFVRVPSKVHIDTVDEPVPTINASKLWDNSPPVFHPEPDLHTVSVEVLSVYGGSTIEITKGIDNGFVFYEAETLAIVHRAKSRSSGLVMTKVWAWSGRKAEAGELEERKMQDLAKRYGTSLIKCEQCTEPQQLVHVLGGSLTIRQGKRSLWSKDDTTMHMVRTLAGLILIDEVDLNVKNLCSGFSYCICVLDTIWVWYGCGSKPAERIAALRYAQTLGSGDSEKNVIEVEEGQEDEMFWMFLGEDGYASADYWKWRKGEKSTEPRFWRVDCANSGTEVQELASIPPPSEVLSAVLVIQLAYEIFTLVGSAARGQRRNIKLGLTLAQDLSSYTARSKPFRPPVHVLIFPSQIPLDLQAAVRGLRADAIHGDEVPDHMNLLTLNDAWTQIQQKVWDQNELEDGNMMPLGFTP